MLSDKKWELEVDTNLKAMIRGTFLAFKYMGKDNGGKGGLVINNSSITGLQPLAGAPVYSTTKHGVLGIARNFGADFHYNRTCIRVVTICPGVTTTELFSSVAGNQYNEEWGKEAERDLKSQPPQGNNNNNNIFSYAVYSNTKLKKRNNLKSKF
ncbi:hypothetical protein C0J52_05935 [Blattella germanica]|nr:hypothetical protein C0J52_05935 [Blattella germanica]